MANFSQCVNQKFLRQSAIIILNTLFARPCPDCGGKGTENKMLLPISQFFCCTFCSGAFLDAYSSMHVDDVMRCILQGVSKKLNKFEIALNFALHIE